MIFIIISLSFFGFYAIVLLLYNAGMGGFTREITVPVRIAVLAALLALMIFNANTLKTPWQTKYFYAFSFFYVLRVLIDYYYDKPYYLPTSDVLFYFLSYALIPYISLSTFRINERYLSAVFNSLLVSGVIFSAISFLFYRQFVGRVGRLSESTTGEEVVSPLILSYCSTLIVGIIVAYLLYNKTSKWTKLVGIATVVLSVIPFFLGASRGSLFALFIPFLFMIFSRRSLTSTIKNLFILLILGVGVSYLDKSLNSGLLDRVFGISKDIDEGASSVVRIEIWKCSFNQFLDNPIFGDKLRVDNWNGYPHNLILEVSQTMGAIGLVFFTILIVNAAKISLRLFKYFPKYGWLSVIFMQAFIQHMFSGAIYTAVWLWVSMALLFSVNKVFKLERY